jgi:hypothetical protein
MLTQALEAEVEAVIATYAELVDEQGRRRVVGNGHAPDPLPDQELAPTDRPVAIDRARILPRGSRPGDDKPLPRREPGRD